MANYRIVGGDQKVYGPVSAEDLRRWIAENRLNGQSMIQAEGATEWKPLASFPEFAEALRIQTGQALQAGAAGPALSTEAWTAEILARQPQVQIGRCLSLGWRLWLDNFGLLLGASLLVWAINPANLFAPLILPLAKGVPGIVFGSLAGIAYWIVSGALYGGLYRLFLARIRGQPASVAGAFSGFGPAFGQLVLAGVIASLLSSVGACLCVVPGIYLAIAWVFSIPLIADRRLEFWSAMELSRKVVTRVWFETFGLILLAFLPVIITGIVVAIKISIGIFSVVGEITASSNPDPARLAQTVMEASRVPLPLVMTLKLVLLLNLPFALGALMYAYEDLFGTRPAATA